MRNGSWTPECFGQRPAGVVAVSITELSALERILICTDGTVTDLLQSSYLEKMRLILVSQFRAVANESSVVLSVSAADPLLIRSVVLQGAMTLNSYLQADSEVVLGRVSSEVMCDLDQGKKPIGMLLRDFRFEMRRELLWFGKEVAGQRAVYLKVGQKDLILTRQYRILTKSLPVMLITERFAPRVNLETCP